MYQRPQNHGYHAAKLAKNQNSKNLVLMRKTSFACGFTSIERRTIFDLWQMSYAARSSLRSLRYASQKTMKVIRFG